MKYLAIDYGKKKFGTAFSDGVLASSGKVVAISGLQDALLKVKKIISDNNIEIVIVGLSESSEARQITDKFIAALKNDMIKKVQIIEAEETLSSLHARQFMVKTGAPKKKRSQEDAYAAAEILQEYIDSL